MSDVAIIGNGNVGKYLYSSLSGIHELSVFTRSDPNGELLTNIDPQKFEYIILAVSDDAIQEVSANLTPSNAIILHTSGSTPLDILDTHTHKGVLYPFQTLGKGNENITENFPLFIEGSDNAIDKIRSFAKSFHKKVLEVNSDNRLQLHVAAVFACNFTNHLYTIADSLLKEMGCSLKDISHLMNETTSKALGVGPNLAQTGPAVRNDKKTIEKHLNVLENNTKLAEIYSILTSSIIDHANKT